MKKIYEKRGSIVFYSAKLPEVCPKTYLSLTSILDKYGVPHSGLKLTNDIWVRDFMPIQVYPDIFKIYDYMPDYLRKSKKYRHLITEPTEVCQANGIDFDKGLSGIRIDGGNVVRCGEKVIMTAKVFEENPGFTVYELSRLLEMNFGAELIILPWDAN